MQPDIHRDKNPFQEPSILSAFREANPFYEGIHPDLLPSPFKERVLQALTYAQERYQGRSVSPCRWKMVVSATAGPGTQAWASGLEWFDYQMDHDAPDAPIRPERYGYMDGLMKYELAFKEVKDGSIDPISGTRCLEFLQPETSSFRTDEEEVQISFSYTIYRAWRTVAKSGEFPQ